MINDSLQGGDLIQCGWIVIVALLLAAVVMITNRVREAIVRRLR